MAKFPDIFDDVDVGPWVKLPKAIFERFGDLGMTTSELAVLITIWSCFPNRCPSDQMVADRCGKTRSYIHRLVGSLKKKGILSFTKKHLDNGGYVRKYDWSGLVNKLKLTEEKKVPDKEPPPPVEQPTPAAPYVDEPDEPDPFLDAFFESRMNAHQEEKPKTDYSAKFQQIKQRVSRIYPVHRLVHDIDLDEVVADLYTELSATQWPNEDVMFKVLEQRAEKAFKAHTAKIRWSPMKFNKAVTTAYNRYIVKCEQVGDDPMLLTEFIAQITNGKLMEYVNESILHQS